MLDWINGLSTDTPVPDVVEDTKPVTIECTPANETYQVTYGAIISKIKDSCSSNGCHTGGSQAGGLALDDEVFIQNTVGVKAKGNADLYLIHPGEPEQSFLLQRLQGAEGTGSQMPLGGTPFNDEELELFVNWIDDCASSKAEKGVPTTP